MDMSSPALHQNECLFHETNILDVSQPALKSNESKVGSDLLEIGAHRTAKIEAAASLLDEPPFGGHDEYK